MKIKLNRDVYDTELKQTIKKGTTIERDSERGKKFLAYGTEVKEDPKPKKKRSKKE